MKKLVTIAIERELAGPAPGARPSKRGQAEVAAFLRELDRVSRKISAAWPEGVSAVEAIREHRRYGLQPAASPALRSQALPC